MDVQTQEQGKDSVHPPARNAAGDSPLAASHKGGTEPTPAVGVESSPAEGRQSLESVASTENLVQHEPVDAGDSNPGHPERVKNLSTVDEIEAKSDHVAATSDGQTKYDLIYQSIEGMEGDHHRGRKSKSRRSTSCYEKIRLIGEGKSKNNSGNVNISAGGHKVGKFAAGCAADCAAVSCCPCLVVHVLFVAVVKVPMVCARKAFSYAKKKTVTHKKEKNDDVEGEDRSKKARSYSMAWSSLRESPVCSGPLDGSTPVRTPVDPNNVWVELYAAGHMGFAGPAIERH